MASTLHAEPQQTVTRDQNRETELVVEVRDLMTEINNPISTFRSEWQTLFDQDPQASIFQHPDFVRCELLPHSFRPTALKARAPRPPRTEH